MFRKTCFAVICIMSAGAVVAQTTRTPINNPTTTRLQPDVGLHFIDTSFENASPLWYEIDTNGVVQVYLTYDNERSSPNRAAGHWHFLLHGRPGAKLTLVLNNLDNIWNGRLGSIAREANMTLISEDGRNWRPIPIQQVPVGRLQFEVQLTGPRLYVARVEPYRLSDLNQFLASIRNHPLVQLSPIGKTVEGRELEILRIGKPDAPYRVFIRTRAHPWEAGGNWVVHGLVNRLLKDDANAKQYSARYCTYIMPMANKDGVVRGRTRFNLQGQDLNRDWGKPADATLCPENHALEVWLQGMIQNGQAPHLALEMHNDGNGRLHISRPPVPGLEAYLERMKLLETLLRKHTWFTEGSTAPSYSNSGTLGDGWLSRFGIDAVVHELNATWIAGLKDYPNARHWQDYGANLCIVLDEYFATAGLAPQKTPVRTNN